MLRHVSLQWPALTVLDAWPDACAARAGCSSNAVTEDFSAAAVQCAAVSTNSSLCTLLDALIDPHSAAVSFQTALPASCANRCTP